MKILNLLGKKFGKLTVLNLCNNRTKDGQTIWHCVCDCGNQKNVIGSKLVSGNTKSCGCLKNHIGKKFNHLTILNQFVVSKTRYCECLCDCGNICTKLTNNVVSGTTKTCGCRFGLIKHKHNKIVLGNSAVYIYINNSKNPAIIDLEDYDKIKDFYWNINEGNYVYTRKTKKRKATRIFLHRLIVPIFDNNLCIDHINGDPLDNRKCNLRVVTIQQNCCNRKKQINNTTGCTGVTMNKDKFLAFLTYNHKYINLGRYDNFKDAVKARKDAEVKYFGEYRRA